MKTVLNSPYRPVYHIAPPCGLLNDPNGLCYADGKYHVFYQWYPFEAKHDMKHWNHVSSEDLVHWKEEEGILVPDLEYEKNGCYSGNAYVDPESGNIYLYYTANFKDDNGVRIPQQALAVMHEDGRIVKSEENPILNKEPDMISVNIRDPFVFEYKDSLYMLLGAEDKEHKGCVLVYKGTSPQDWDYLGVLDIRLNGESIDLGKMVECPGFITAKEDVLFISLIDSNSWYFPHENRFDSIALIGKFHPEKLTFEAETLEVLDFGFDFYAPQPFYGKDDKPLFFAWFGCANEELPEDKYHWRHALTLPREIIVEDHKLRTPVHSEVKKQFKTLKITEQDPGLIKSSNEPILINWEVTNDEQAHSMRVGGEQDYYEVIVDFPKNEVRIDRTGLMTKVDPEYGMVRSFPIEKGKDVKIELLLDNSFNELYLNEGEKVLSFRSYEENLRN